MALNRLCREVSVLLPVVWKSRDVPYKVAVPHNRNLSRGSFATSCLGFWPLEDITQGNLFMANNWLFVGVSPSRFFGHGSEFWQGESMGDDMLGNKVLPPRQSSCWCCGCSDKLGMDKILSCWPLRRSLGTGPRFYPCLMMESECFIWSGMFSLAHMSQF